MAIYLACALTAAAILAAGWASAERDQIRHADQAQLYRARSARQRHRIRRLRTERDLARRDLTVVTAELARGWEARDRQTRPSPEAIALEAAVLADIAALPTPTDPRRPEEDR
jgi:hypothetical protein